jgi:hypothetical protein
MRNRAKRQVTISSIRAIDPLKLIKVQLDARTIVTVKNMLAFELWLSKFPSARIIPN